MLYVEDENGKAVDGHVASEIRKYARSIWVHIAKTRGAPPKWGDAGVEIAQIYRQHMYGRFPILRFCELDWKVDLIATDNYPSWYSWFKKPTKKKGDAKDEEDEPAITIPEVTPLKRAHDSSSDVLLKRTKVTEDIGNIETKETGESPRTDPSLEASFQVRT